MFWGIEDLVAVAALLGGAAAMIAIGLRVFRKPWPRLVWSALVLLIVLIVWAELAVGIFH